MYQSPALSCLPWNRGKASSVTVFAIEKIGRWFAKRVLPWARAVAMFGACNFLGESINPSTYFQSIEALLRACTFASWVLKECAMQVHIYRPWGRAGGMDGLNSSTLWHDDGPRNWHVLLLRFVFVFFFSSWHQVGCCFCRCLPVNWKVAKNGF